MFLEGCFDSADLIPDRTLVASMGHFGSRKAFGKTGNAGAIEAQKIST